MKARLRVQHQHCRFLSALHQVHRNVEDGEQNTEAAAHAFHALHGAFVFGYTLFQQVQTPWLTHTFKSLREYTICFLPSNHRGACSSGLVPGSCFSARLALWPFCRCGESVEVAQDCAPGRHRVMPAQIL